MNTRQGLKWVSVLASGLTVMILVTACSRNSAKTPVKNALAATQVSPGLERVAFGQPKPVKVSRARTEGLYTADLIPGGGMELVVVHAGGQVSVVELPSRTGEPRILPKFRVGFVVGPAGFADFNEDGRMDMVIGSQGRRAEKTITGNPCGSDLSANNRVPVFLGKGDGTLELKKPCPSLETSYAFDDRFIGGLEVADLDRDGHMDIALTRSGNYGKNYIALMFGKGDGTFPRIEKIELRRPEHLELLDFDGDGDLDLVVSTVEKSVLFSNNGHGNFVSHASFTPPLRWRAADLNKDGRQDLVGVDFYKSRIVVRLGNGTGHFDSNSQTLPLMTRFLDHFQVLDLDQDGWQDLISQNDTPSSLHIHFGGPDGFSESHQTVNLHMPINRFVAADLDGDHLDDVFTSVSPRGVRHGSEGRVLFQWAVKPRH